MLLLIRKADQKGKPDRQSSTDETHIFCGHSSGFCSLCPRLNSVTISLFDMPGYGNWAKVITSHSVTP
jgi:hypothetical protein